MTKLTSVCALDCPDTCSLHISVQDGRVTKLEGNPDHPITRGFACAKMYRYPERHEHPDRLLYPQKRTGKKGEGKFQRIPWQQALDEIAEHLKTILKTHGPQAVLPYCYCGTMGVLESQHPLAFFRAIGALELDWTICASTGSAAWEANYGPFKLGVDPEETAQSRFVILWGINALRSNSHFAPWLKAARQNGAHILHIDPFRNETSRFADEHWQIRVGTDAALALAFGREILQQQWEDKDYLAQHATSLDDYRAACEPWTIQAAAEYCDVDAVRLRAVIEQYAKAGSSFIKVGYGMTRNEGGGNALRAVTLLPALVGAWKQTGGGATLSTSGGFHLNHRLNRGEHLLRPNVRHVNMNLLGDELSREQEPIKAMFVFNSNPAAVAPDSRKVASGLCRDDLFTVVLDHFQTDTADYADYLLPATDFLEHPDLYTSYGHYYLQWAEPVVEPRGECRSNSWFFSELAKRLELSESTLYWTPHQLAESLLESNHPMMQGVTWERLSKERSLKLNLPTPFRPYTQGSHHPDKKIRFSPAPRQLEFEEQPCSEYPFRLISPPGPFILNTSMGNLESIRKMAGGVPQMVLHPDDAASIGIQDGQVALVESRYGSIRRHVLVSSDAKKGVAVALGQWWPKFAPDKKSLNELTSQRLTDLGGGSTFGNPAVRISPTQDGSTAGENPHQSQKTLI
jgi:anaerobic selenocysteine-containing dehydrogenase